MHFTFQKSTPLPSKICAIICSERHNPPSFELIKKRGSTNRSANQQLGLHTTDGLADDYQQAQQSQKSDVDPLPRNYSGVETAAICLAL